MFFLFSCRLHQQNCKHDKTQNASTSMWRILLSAKACYNLWCTCDKDIIHKNIGKNYFLFISTLNLSPYHLQNLDDKDDELLLWNNGVLKLWCASRFNPHSIAPTPTGLQNLIYWWWKWQIMIHKSHHELVI